MRNLIRLSAAASLLFGVSFAQAQTTAPAPAADASGGKLAFLLPGLFEQAIRNESPTRQRFLREAISPRWISLNASVAVQLSNLPNPSPASAFAYSYDPESGAMKRTPQSLGPLLTERAETIGKGKFFFAVTYQRFNFDRLDDVDLRGFAVSAQFTAPPGVLVPLPIPVEAQLEVDGNISLQVSQTTAHFTYGITPWLDASYAFPIVTSSLSLLGGGIVTAPAQNSLIVATLERQLAQTSATGLGDGVLRVKGRFLRRGNVALALATDMRLPIGDEFNYHGAGAYGVKPFLVASLTTRKISPHINAGYQWNGKSSLASYVATEQRHLPSQIFYAVGFDAGLSPRMTLAIDFLDQYIVRGQRTFLRPPASTTTTAPNIYFVDANRHEYNMSYGFKAQLTPDLVMSGNVLLRLNEAGLRSRVVPLVGLSYLF